MHLIRLPEKKTGRILLLFGESKRINGKNTNRTVERIGYLDEFTDLYADPIAHFKQVAKERTVESKVKLELSLSEHFSFEHEYHKQFDRRDTTASFSSSELSVWYGMLPLSRIYHELELDYFLNNRRRYTKASYNHNAIFQMLVYGRILFPDSKLGTWQDRNKLLGNMEFTDDDVYRSLGFFAKHKGAMVRHLHKKVGQLYGRDTSLMFYDVTNYYWEVDTEDDMRRRGCSKEHRPEPIVQMGLLMDSNALPVTYGLFSGNTNDCLTLSPMMGEVCEDLRAQGVVYIADKGMMSGDNRAEILINKGGYVFSSSVRGANKETQQFVTDESGFIGNADGTYQYKSRIVPVEVSVTDLSTGRKQKVTINERQIVFWSKKYQDRTRYEREKALQKAAAYGSCENNQGGNKYFKKVVVNKIDGEVIEHKDYVRILDEDLLSKDEALDGYYLICTNVIGLGQHEHSFTKRSRFLDDNMFQLNRVVTDQDIIEMYRGLWRIEESFRITKSWLKARPVFVHTEASIEAHFLTCFVGLLLLRILELKTERSIEVNRMVESLRKAQLVYASPDVLISSYCDNILARIGSTLDLDMTKMRYTVTELDKLLAKTRKTDPT
jgi:transposase